MRRNGRVGGHRERLAREQARGGRAPDPAGRGNGTGAKGPERGGAAPPRHSRPPAGIVSMAEGCTGGARATGRWGGGAPAGSDGHTAPERARVENQRVRCCRLASPRLPHACWPPRRGDAGTHPHGSICRVWHGRCASKNDMRRALRGGRLGRLGHAPAAPSPAAGGRGGRGGRGVVGSWRGVSRGGG